MTLFVDLMCENLLKKMLSKKKWALIVLFV